MDVMYGYGESSDYDNMTMDDIYDIKSEDDGSDFLSELNELASQPLISDECFGLDEFDLNFGGSDPFVLLPFNVNTVVSGQHNLNSRNSNSKSSNQSIKDSSSPFTSWNSNTGINGVVHGVFDQENSNTMVLVDPQKVVPVYASNFSGSLGSTASSVGSETDQDYLPTTDEEESECEVIPGTIATWIVPDSRSPSPVETYEVDEPEFIGSPIVQEPPVKKRKQKHEHIPKPDVDGKIYPKPAFSYSCLIAMALKNSRNGSLPVSEIYKFMCDHFPYFKTAPSGWKNSVRHNLSLNKCFEKIEKPGNSARKGCLWALNPAKIHKMDEEVQKWSRKDPMAIRRAMSDPENLELIERGELKRDYSGNGASDEDEEEDFSEPATPLTPAQMQARRSRTNSSDSSAGDTLVTSTNTAATISQVHAALHRPVEQKIHIKKEDTTALDFGTITSVQGNYLCHSANGTGTYTLSFATSLGNTTTPIIIRRANPVK
jgi:hypothetical protein